MADIDIVPKRRTSIWLWVAIVLIVLAVLVFWLMGMIEPRSVTTRHDPGTGTTQTELATTAASPRPA